MICKKIFFTLLLWAPGIHAQWHYIPFDTSMRNNGDEKPFRITKKIVGIDGHLLYTLFKNTYEQYNPTHCHPSDYPRIPLIIHQIWLGSDVPEIFAHYRQSWIAAHVPRGWTYHLWTDADIQALDLYNKKLYDATDNYGMKSDIARLEIIDRFGGVYVDIDFECLQPLDLLHYTYDFYIGVQPLDSFFVQLNNALFGACPHHPIVRHAIESMAYAWNTYHGAPQKTGPVHVTRSFYAIKKNDRSARRDIAFPASYFYPFGTQEKMLNKADWLINGSYAVHWWAKSWMPKQYRSKKFRSIENEASTAHWDM
ncbi:MAG TPA: glycosyltransferase [Candidatus Bathyarchaeia archaeon]|nr:glycosyltransferase [Candidatus Bathyarchaeia archaeon]